MTPYLNLSGTSNVQAYYIAAESITVQFNGSSKLYTYSYRVAGREHVENMKVLAQRGSGLNSYIMKNVRTAYDR